MTYPSTTRSLALACSMLLCLAAALPRPALATAVSSVYTACYINAARTSQADGGAQDVCDLSQEYYFNDKIGATANGSAQAIVNPGDVGLSLYASTGAYDQFYAGADVTATASYQETLKVGAGSGLAVGSPVQVLLTHQLDYSLSQSLQIHSIDYMGSTYTSIVRNSGWLRSTIQVAAQDPNGGYQTHTEDVTFSAFEGDVTYANPDSFWTVVGATLQYTHQLSGECKSYAEQPAQNQPYATTGSCTLFAGGSSHAYFDVLTPGAYLTSESGHDYSLPPATGSTNVPEPATLSLMMAALAALPFCRRRRTDT